MERILVAFSLFAGCVFSPGTKSSDSPDAGTDARSGSGMVAGKCHVSDPTLRLCLDFEDALTPTTADLSAGKHDATVSGIQGMPRGQQQAASVTTASRILVPETADLDITSSISMEMWLEPNLIQDPGSYPLQNNRQYELAFDKHGSVSCALVGVTVGDPGVLALDQWTHVACTYDGLMIKLFRDGDVVKCRLAFGPIPTSGTTGTAIGAARYSGGIDDVHVYARALTEAEICARAGRSSCNPNCPTSPIDLGFGHGH